MRESAAEKCFSLSIDSASASESIFPCAASEADFNNKSVTPDIAEAITTTRGYSSRASLMICMALVSASVEPTDDPPNFMTSVCFGITCSLLCTTKCHQGAQRFDISSVTPDPLGG